MLVNPSQSFYVALDEFYYRRPIFFRPGWIDVDVVELIVGDRFSGVAQTGEAFVDRKVRERNSQDCPCDGVGFQRAQARGCTPRDDRQRKIPRVNKSFTLEKGE